MIWALLALLGIPVWFMLLVLAIVFHQRKVVLKRDDIFWYRTRTDTGWARHKGVARWASDVLVRHEGIALVRTLIDPVTTVEVNTISGNQPKGLGDDALEIRLTLAGQESPLRLAVSADSRDRARGPARLRDQCPEQKSERPAKGGPMKTAANVSTFVRAESDAAIEKIDGANGGRHEL